jgi:pimeloyl-ACP methyl ester carboxylesterase
MGWDLFVAAQEYWCDAWERSILTLDVLRQRGNNYVERTKQTAPHVLTFTAEVVMDGRKLERPVNYARVRIVPPDGTVIDPRKRPFIVFDPRAGHGPGIGGMKQDSEIGVALKAGHACYFVGFLPEPVPGQTIADVCAAEARFVEKVIALSPEAEGKPVLIGNCQAGWQIMMMAAIHPDLPGPIMLAGSPLSYWAGVRGKNPMRYLGGLLGGTWLTALAGDLGNGIFDGANLVANFEAMHPSNTWWTKPYNLYSKVDTEAPRFLEFEKWWGSPVLLNAEEMQSIADELFVGNKLSSGQLRTADGVRVDLREIRSPIIVFCSWGDDITPPQQALHWILDLYEHDGEIVAAGQTIVYCLHQSIGHLGIFVSGKVASKEHGEFAQAMDMIDLVPPGLYEAVITGLDETVEHVCSATVRPAASRTLRRGSGAAIPLGQLAKIELTQGPSTIRTENALLALYIYVDIRGRDLGGLSPRLSARSSSRSSSRPATSRNGAASSSIWSAPRRGCRWLCR